MKRGIKKLATKGIMWSGISQGSTQIFRFVVTIILARLLLPQDFGLLGMATIFIGLISMVNEMGLSAAIIQRKEITEKHLSTTFWVSLIFGTLLCFITIAVSPYVADFFNEPRIEAMLQYLSLVFVIGAFSIVHSAILAKRLDFKKLAAVEIGSEVSCGLLAIILALLGYGVWSLVWRMIAGTVVLVILLWVMNPWRPGFIFDLKSFKELFSFGGNVMGSNILDYARRNVDYLSVGKVLGPAPLGYYTLAYQMTTFPVSRISSIVNRVTFPAFSMIQEENETMKDGYTKVVKYISLITFPMILGLFAVSAVFIPVVLGSNWVPMILPLQILCIAGAMQSVGSPVSSLLRSKGRADIEFKWNALTLIVITAAILIGVNYGIAGVAFAVSATIICLGWLLQWMVNKLISLSLYDFLKALFPAAFSSIIMLAAVGIFQAVMPDTTDPAILLTGSIAVGIIGYGIILMVLFYETLTELKEIIRGTVRSH